MVFIHKYKKIIYWKIHPLLKKLKSMKKNIKIIGCDNGDKNKTLEEDCANTFEEIDF